MPFPGQRPPPATLPKVPGIAHASPYEGNTPTWSRPGLRLPFMRGFFRLHPYYYLPPYRNYGEARYAYSTTLS